MIIALKGFIGSGKTTIGNLLKENYNFEVIIADDIVAKMYEDISLQQDVIKALNIERFDKKVISKIVFSDNEKLKVLEAIVHPILEQKIKEIINVSTSDIVLDCQVIDKLDLEYDYEIITTCSKEEIIKRVMKRDNKTQEAIEKIIKSQESFILQTKKVFPIETQTDQEDLERKLKKIITIFTKDLNKAKYEDEDDEDEDDFYW